MMVQLNIILLAEGGVPHMGRWGELPGWGGPQVHTGISSDILFCGLVSFILKWWIKYCNLEALIWMVEFSCRPTSNLWSAFSLMSFLVDVSQYSYQLAKIEVYKVCLVTRTFVLSDCWGASVRLLSLDAVNWCIPLIFANGWWMGGGGQFENLFGVEFLF